MRGVFQVFEFCPRAAGLWWARIVGLAQSVQSLGLPGTRKLMPIRLCLKCEEETSNRFLCDACRKENARERPGICGTYSPLRGRERIWTKRNRALKAETSA